MYMQATTGSGGWPLNLFLDPNTLSPFYGGMYWPSAISSNGKASFREILDGVIDVWHRDQQKCIESAQTVRDKLVTLHEAQSGAEYDELRLSIFDEVRDHFQRHFDATYGGFTEAPKFPCAHNLSFLLKFGEYLDAAEEPGAKPGAEPAMSFREKSLFTLRKMATSALKDQLGHGFHRYSVTIDWSLPHFEKLLIDQALLLSAYTHAYQAVAATPDSDSGIYAHYMKDIVTFITTTLSGPNGAFYSAQDSDSLPSRSILSPELEAGQYPLSEGAYYVWQANDFAEPLTRFETDVASAHWNVQELGNINGEFDVYHTLAFQNTLFSAMPSKEIAAMFGKKPSVIRETIESARQKLRDHRAETRDEPGVDEKVLAGWNGAAIGALAQASNALAVSDPKTSNLALRAAEKAAEFVLANLFDKKNGTLRRMYSYGRPSTTQGMIDDYVYLISGLLDLYQATFNTAYLDHARRLQEIQLVLFWDQLNGGFFTVPKEHTKETDDSELMLTPKQGFDGSEPSANGVACENLFRLSAHLGDDRFFESYAEQILECYGKDLTAQPFGYASMLGSVVAKLKGFRTVLVVGGHNDASDASVQTLMTELTRRRLIPNLAVTRITQSDVDEFYEPYGNSFYGALQDKYGDGPAKYIVLPRGHHDSEYQVLDTVDQVLQVFQPRNSATVNV